MRKVEGGKWKEESGKRLEINNQQRIPPMHLDGILILSPIGVLWSILFPLSSFHFPLSSFLSSLLELLHNLSLNLLAELGIVLEQRLHGITALTQFRVSVREP